MKREIQSPYAGEIIMRSLKSAAIFSMALVSSGCGLSVPSKNLTTEDQPDPVNGSSQQAYYETQIIGHIGCEMAMAVFQADARWKLPWLREWGTAVTLIITAQDQSGLNAGASLISPLQNFTKTFPAGGLVTIPQTFTLGLGATGSLNATRSETIQVTWANADLLEYGKSLVNAISRTGKTPCVDAQKGAMIDGDLRLREFVFDKAQLAWAGDGNPALVGGLQTKYWPLYNTMTEEIIFLSAFGGSVTPSWKLARLSTSPTASFAVAQRTYTNDLIVTMGTIAQRASAQHAAQLGPAAQNQHNARVNASAIATSIAAQSH